MQWKSLVVALTVGAGCSAPEPSTPETSSGGRDGSLASVTGEAPPATGGFASVVVLEPTEAELPAGKIAGREPPVLDQFGTDFHPRVLLAVQGDRIRFRNSEDVLHNVHVKDRSSGETVFNVATIPYGSYEHGFETPGVYDVSCDTHPAMAAFIVVTRSPYATVAETRGAFELAGVPPGRYRLSVWNLDPERRLEREVEIVAPRTEIALLP